MHKDYIVIIFLLCSFTNFSQENTVDIVTYKTPKSCDELEQFVQTVFDSSLFFKKQVQKIVTQLESDVYISSCSNYAQILTIIGFNKLYANDILKSRHYLLRADSIYKTRYNPVDKYLIRNKIFLGQNYDVFQDTIKSSRYLNEASALASEINNLTLLADSKHSLAVLSLNSNQIEKADQIVKEALHYSEISGNHEITAFASLTQSRISRIKGEYNSALKDIETAKKIFKQLSDTVNLYLAELYTAEIYTELGNQGQAIQKLLNAEKLGNENNHKVQHATIYKQLGNLHTKTDYKKSIKYFEEAFKYSPQLNEEEMSDIINELSNYYADTKNIYKQRKLVKDLKQFYNSKQEEFRVELLESNQKEIAIQNEINENKILKIKNATSRKRYQLISLASIFCILFGIYALIQFSKNKILNIEINKQNKILHNQNLELKNFASVASHDLKAPVRSITSFASLIERKLPKEIDPKILNYLEIIKTSSVNMNSLVSSLLEFSTLGNREIDIIDINIEKLFSDVSNNLYSLIKLKNAEIHIADNMPKYIKGDETLLKIVFQNIINNALKFVSEDKTPCIRIQYHSEENNHHFKIIDNGIGIRKEYLEKIFLIFERLHSKSEFEGSGIGLATCKKIISLHQGKINIESVPDEGSTFTITLPKSKSE